jgi:hypothetical protein
MIERRRLITSGMQNARTAALIWDPGQETSYADVTGMALIALSDFDDEYAQTLISGAVQFLNDAWLSSDVFNNANTISAAISGLCAAGEVYF